MKSVLTLLILVAASVLPGKSQSNVTSYSIFFLPPSGTNITYFSTTLVVPNVPPDDTSKGNVQEVWYGLAPVNFPQALEHQIQNEENGPPSTEWNFVPAYCCDPGLKLTNASLRTWPGDKITSIFSKSDDGGWNTFWTNVPGPSFPNTTVVGFSGSSTLGPDSLVGPPMSQVVFQIEVEGANTWDFGPVTFTNIEIDAETTDSSWCDLELPIAYNQGPPFNFHINGANASLQEDGTLTKCTINSIVFLGPQNQNASTTAQSSQTTTSRSTSSTSSSTRSAIGGPSESSKSGVGKIEAHFGGLFLVISTILSISC